MTVHETIIAKICRLPEPLVQEVSDFVDFLLTKRDAARWQLWTQFAEGLAMAEADFSDYLAQLENYEQQLARGEIQW